MQSCADCASKKTKSIDSSRPQKGEVLKNGRGDLEADHTSELWVTPSRRMITMTENDIETYTSLPLKPCRRAGCPELVRGGGYCDKHQRTVRRMRRDTQGERGVSGEWHGLYYTARWREMRAEQLIMEPYCRDCVAHGVRSAATDVDHIVPHRGDRKLFYDKTNLQSLCHSCHSRKTIAEQSFKDSPPP